MGGNLGNAVISFNDLAFAVKGLHDDSPFLSIAVTCRHCGELLAQNRWDIRIISKEDVTHAVERDLPMAVAHQCPSTEQP